MVGVICAVSSLSVSSTTRRTGAEIEPASSRAPAAFSNACSAASAPLALSARSSALETSVVAPNSSAMMSTSGSGGSEPSDREKLRGVPVTPSVTR